MTTYNFGSRTFLCVIGLHYIVRGHARKVCFFLISIVKSFNLELEHVIKIIL